MRRRTFIGNSIRVAGGLLVAACAPGTGGPAASSGPVVRDLIFGTATEVTGGEPFHNAGGPQVKVYNSLFDTITGRTLDYKLEPRLAESWKLLDQTTWQFKLKSGVKFH